MRPAGSPRRAIRRRGGPAARRGRAPQRARPLMRERGAEAATQQMGPHSASKRRLGSPGGSHIVEGAVETEYLDEEAVIALYNKVRTGKKTWPTGIWSSPAALQYAVTVFDYWIHNVMGWKGWPEARGKVTPALLEEHRLADLVESVFVPEFGDDWLDFEVVLNESMRLSEDEGWAPDVSDRQERVEAAFEQAFEELIASC